MLCVAFTYNLEVAGCRSTVGWAGRPCLRPPLWMWLRGNSTEKVTTIATNGSLTWPSSAGSSVNISHQRIVMSLQLHSKLAFFPTLRLNSTFGFLESVHRCIGASVWYERDWGKVCGLIVIAVLWWFWWFRCRVGALHASTSAPRGDFEIPAHDVRSVCEGIHGQSACSAANGS